MADIELKPCPFCKSKEISIKEYHVCKDWILWYVRCNDCYYNTACFSTKDKAVEAWNRRYDNG